jgi:hypothetical protein
MKIIVSVTVKSKMRVRKYFLYLEELIYQIPIKINNGIIGCNVCLANPGTIHP